MGLGKTLQSLITVALITLELSVMKDSVQQNNKTTQIDNENDINDINDVSTNMKNNGKKNTKKTKKTKITKNVNNSNNANNANNANNSKNDVNSINSVTVGRSLVICPASLALHWEGEIKKFFPYANLLISELYTNNNNNINNNGSNDGSSSSMYINNKNDNNNNNKICLESDSSSSFSPSVVVVASYDSVRKNNNNYFTNQVSFISQLHFISCFLTFLFLFSYFLAFLLLILHFEFFLKVWDCVILDEAHTVRNPLSSTAKAIFKLKAKCRIALSGTPIQNHVRTYVFCMYVCTYVRALLICMCN